jgi:RNA polymerase sigma-70 factor (ECF subfamily)
VAADVRHQIVELLPRLRRFAYVLTGDADRSDDLVQETCVRALSRLDQWEQGTRLDSWMYRIAQNAWIDRVRAQKVRSELVDTDATIRLACEDGRQVIENQIALRDVFDAIALLPPDQKIVVALVCIEGLSYKRAAETLQIPMGTLMSRLARARRTLYIAIHGQPDTGSAKAERSYGRAVR